LTKKIGQIYDILGSIKHVSLFTPRSKILEWLFQNDLTFYQELDDIGVAFQTDSGYITEEPSLIWIYPQDLNLCMKYLMIKKSLPLHKDFLEHLDTCRFS